MVSPISGNPALAAASQIDEHVPAATPDLSVTRLYMLRAAYLFIGVGMGSLVWPIALSHTSDLANLHGARYAMLAGLSAMALWGLRYPVKMLPLLLFEMAWKLVYLAAFALPLWVAHDVSAATAENISAVFWGLLIVIGLIPWRFVLAHFALQRGDRWK